MLFNIIIIINPFSHSKLWEEGTFLQTELCNQEDWGASRTGFLVTVPTRYCTDICPPIHTYLPTTYFNSPYITPRLHPSRSTVCIVPSLPTGIFLLWGISYFIFPPPFSPLCGSWGIIYSRRRWRGWVILSRVCRFCGWLEKVGEKFDGTCKAHHGRNGGRTGLCPSDEHECFHSFWYRKTKKKLILFVQDCGVMMGGMKTQIIILMSSIERDTQRHEVLVGRRLFLWFCCWIRTTLIRGRPASWQVREPRGRGRSYCWSSCFFMVVELKGFVYNTKFSLNLLFWTQLFKDLLYVWDIWGARD